jgi:hypothetical protein
MWAPGLFTRIASGESKPETSRRCWRTRCAGSSSPRTQATGCGLTVTGVKVDAVVVRSRPGGASRLRRHGGRHAVPVGGRAAPGSRSTISSASGIHGLCAV